MGLKIYHDISGIYCDNDINDDNSGNPVSLEKSIIFPIFTPNRVLWALLSTHIMQWLFNSYWTPEGALAQKPHTSIAEVILLTTLHEGIQLSLNKTLNGDERNFNWWNLKTINIRLHKIYGLSVFFNLGYVYKESIFIIGVDRLSAWPIIAVDIKHFYDNRYRPYSKSMCR